LAGIVGEPSPTKIAVARPDMILHQVSGTKLHLGADIFSTTISIAVLRKVRYSSCAGLRGPRTPHVTEKGYILPLRLQIKMAIVILTDFGKFRGIESGSIAAQYPVAAKCKARYSEWNSEKL
jgi:hypothetical protein